MFRHALMFFGAAVHNVACEVFIALLRRFRAERLSLALAIPFVALGAALTSDARGDSVIATIAVPLPGAAVINSATNKIYAANFNGIVYVIDGTTYEIATVPTGSQPMTLALNSVTNKIYTANYAGASVTVINGADNTTATVVTGNSPRGPAVNSVTNKIYVPNYDSNTVTIINGDDNTTATVPTGSSPVIAAVNEVTNKIYVVNLSGNSVTVIDGANNTTQTVAVGAAPFGLAVNSVTNKIYVGSLGTASVKVINGADNSVTTVPIGPAPFIVAVNSVTNKIYVTNRNDAQIHVINGADNTTATIAVGTTPNAIAINEATNKIYVPNYDSSSVTIINGSTNAVATLAVGVNPFAAAINPRTNRIFVTNSNGNSVSVIDGTELPVARVRGDFNGDGRADILWRNTGTGQNYVYPMNGTAILADEGYLRTVADLNWTVAGIGDFDGDGNADILWRNTVTGQNYLYPMEGLAIKPTEGYLRTAADTTWQVVGIGDFDGDGKADIVWRNSSSGENYLYPMDGTTIKASEGFIRTVADTTWQVAGIGDFDGDGKADIVWRNSASGQNYLYPMDGTTIKPTEGYIRTVADLAWQIAAVGDYDGDGKSDLLWRNASTGQNYLYPMDGTTIKPTEGYLRTVPVGNWAVMSK